MLLHSRLFRFLRREAQRKRLVKCAEDPPFQLEFPRKTYLNREVIGTKTEVVSPTERGMLGPEVHFHMLEEVMVLAKKQRICH